MSIPRENLIGKKFNHLTVIALYDVQDKEHRFQWECTCDCGSDEIIIATSRDLKKSRKKSCSCLKNRKINLPVDLKGKIFNRLQVIEALEERNVSGEILWKCLCECGKYHKVATRDLKSGLVKSCGCLKAEISVSTNITHGMSKKPIYKVYTSMLTRCNNPQKDNYDRYGGRGISVCEEWKTFENFYEWSVKSGYKQGLQIDRINNNGDYEPNNCHWVTPKENARNRNNNRYYNIKNEKKTITEWAIEVGITYKTFLDRVERGWTEEELLKPKGYRRK